MATTLWLRNTLSASTAATPAHLDLTAAAGAAEQTATVTTVNSGTEIQWTRSGALALTFASGRVPTAGLTFAAGASITYSFWGKESAAGVNGGLRAKLFQRGWSGTETLINSSDFASELTTTLAEKVWTGTCTSSISLIEDERLLLRVYARNVGTMGAGNATLTYNGGNAANGDSFLLFSATTTLKAESDPAAAVASTTTLTASFQGLLQKQGIVKTASLDALLQGAEQPVASFDAALYRAYTPSVGMDADVQGASTATMVLSSNWTGLLEKQDISLTALADAMTQKLGIARTATLDAVVQTHIGDVMMAVELDAVVFQEEQLAAAMGFAAIMAHQAEEERRRNG